MTHLDVHEEFVTVTELRQALSGLAARFRRRRKHMGECLSVDVVTEHGKPVATVMPYDVYARIRDLLLLARAQADLAAGRVFSFPPGTPAEEALNAIFKRDVLDDEERPKRTRHPKAE